MNDKTITKGMTLGVFGLAAMFFVLLAYFAISHQEQPAVQTKQLAEQDVALNFVSGTEYIPNQDGQVIVEARYVNGSSAISNSSCNASVWYPDKTVFVGNQSMTTSSDGNAYINFTVPQPAGVYSYQSTCVVGIRTLIASHSFHVTKPRLSAEITK